jgi:hypothetical protein
MRGNNKTSPARNFSVQLDVAHDRAARVRRHVVAQRFDHRVGRGRIGGYCRAGSGARRAPRQVPEHLQERLEPPIRNSDMCEATRVLEAPSVGLEIISTSSGSAPEP